MSHGRSYETGQCVALKGVLPVRYGRIVRCKGIGLFYGDLVSSECYYVRWLNPPGVDREVSGNRLRRVSPLEELALASGEVPSPSLRPRIQIDLAKPNG